MKKNNEVSMTSQEHGSSVVNDGGTFGVAMMGFFGGVINKLWSSILYRDNVFDFKNYYTQNKKR